MLSKITHNLSWLILWGCTVALFGSFSAEAAPAETVELQAEPAERMAWWREARFGLFVHFGLYSEHGGELNGFRGGRYSEWLIQHVSNTAYEPLIERFNPVDFDADAIVRLAKQAGMKYIVVTTKHHDGFSMWNSASNPYNTFATPWNRDAMQEMVNACRQHNMPLCWYYSVLDWHHPDYLPRREADTRPADDAEYSRYVDYMKTQLTELLTEYGPIAGLWFDGAWEKGPEQHRAQEIVALLRNIQPQIVINDRLGLPQDYVTPEQHVPEETIPSSDWEACMTIGTSWGYNQFVTDWKTPQTLIRHLAESASKGGNFLLNIGIDRQGRIVPQEIASLQAIGEWMAVNGESIYGTDPTPFYSSASTPWGCCTTKTLTDERTRLYLHVFEWPSDGTLPVPELGNAPTRAYLLNNPEIVLETTAGNTSLLIRVPQDQPDSDNTVVVLDFDGPVVTFHPPQFVAPASEMIGPMEVTLTCDCSELEIRYTLDGTPPTIDSSRYTRPLRLTETTSVTARSFYEDRAVSKSVATTFTQVVPHPTITVGITRPGLNYAYKEAAFQTVDELLAAVTDATGTIATIDLAPRQRDEHFGLIFDGLLRVPADGVYHFEVTCDDGAKLWIGEKLVVDGDGLHAAETYTGTVALAEGLHPLKLAYFNGGGGKQLEVRWAEAGQPLDPIPANALAHQTPE